MKIHYGHTSYSPGEFVKSRRIRNDQKENAWLVAVVAAVDEWLSGVESIPINTSGSTGPPKTIYLKREQMQQSALKTGKAFGLVSGEAALLCLPAYLVAGKMMVVRALVLDMDLHITAPAGNPLQNISSTIDFTAMTPYQAARIIQEDPGLFRLTRKVILGGSPVSDELAEQLKGLQANFWHTYGMTETITHVAVRRLAPGEMDTAYHALEGVSFSLSDAGTLVIHADHLDQAICTNDLVALINPTTFLWRGRADFVINSGGIKIFPESVEKKLKELIPERFFITGEKDPVLGERCVLVIERQMPGKQDASDLQIAVRNALSKYEVPSKIYYVTELKETESGKIKRDIDLYS